MGKSLNRFQGGFHFSQGTEFWIIVSFYTCEYNSAFLKKKHT